MIIAVPADELMHNTPHRGDKAAKALKTSVFNVVEAKIGQPWAASSALLYGGMLLNKSHTGFTGYGGS